MQGISAATILGDGHVALIIDILGIVELNNIIYEEKKNEVLETI